MDVKRVINHIEKENLETSFWDVELEDYRKNKWNGETNVEVLRTVKEKRTLMDAIRARRWKMIGHALRHTEELHDIIIRKKNLRISFKLLYGTN